MTRPHPALRRRHPARGSEGAALLIELIIASVMVITAFAMAMALTNNTALNSKQTNTVGNRESIVNADIALLRNLASRYSFCDGVGSTTPSGSSCRKSGNPDSDYKSEDYYYPDNPDDSGALTNEQRNFHSACAAEPGFDLTANLITAMKASTSYASDLSSAGISRSISLENADAHRLQVRYTGPKVDRTVLITPTVAAWCP